MLSSAYVNTALNQFAPSPRTPTATSTADCLFNWAEKSFPQYFAPTGGKLLDLGTAAGLLGSAGCSVP